MESVWEREVRWNEFGIFGIGWLKMGGLASFPGSHAPEREH